MRSDKPEGSHEATKALTLAVALMTFMLISDLILLILYSARTRRLAAIRLASSLVSKGKTVVVSHQRAGSAS